jgi:hypothetical protein
VYGPGTASAFVEVLPVRRHGRLLPPGLRGAPHRARTGPLPSLEAAVLIACWSTKGGTGTTVVAAALALLLARSTPEGASLVDLAGDIPAALGVPGGDGAGIADWLSAAPQVPADALARLEEPAVPGLGLVRRGRGPLDPGAADLLVTLLATDARSVVVDCGRLDHETGTAHAVAAGAGRSLLVLRPCFLALRRAIDAPLRPSGVVLVAEDGRAITATDVEEALGVPVLARVRVTDSVARAVDAGLLAAHLPRSLARDLRHAA